ncbi:MAG TPA: hypothetical protein VF175_13190, partial [Lacipirellula sp.]
MAVYRLRRAGLYPNAIQRAFVERIAPQHPDIRFIWTGKEYPARTLGAFRGYTRADMAFRPLVMDFCSSAIAERRPQSPLIYCRTPDELYWAVGLKALCPNLRLYGDGE